MAAALMAIIISNHTLDTLCHEPYVRADSLNFTKSM